MVGALVCHTSKCGTPNSRHQSKNIAFTIRDSYPNLHNSMLYQFDFKNTLNAADVIARSKALPCA